MNDDRFDALAKAAMSLEMGGPSELVWKRIRERRRSRLPTLNEIMIAWATSAAVLVTIFLTNSGQTAPTSDPDPPVEIAATDDSSYTVAAVTRIAGPAF